jgi:hypothetical protein
MAFMGAQLIKSKIITQSTTLAKVNDFNYLGCNISYQKNTDIERKLTSPNLHGTIQRTVKNEARRDTQKFMKSWLYLHCHMALKYCGM